MSVRVLLFFVLLGCPLRANPSFQLLGPETIEVSWPGRCGVQYQLSCSSNLDLWTPLGSRLVGFDGFMTARDDVSGQSAKYYRIEEFSEFLLDLRRFKLDTIGNKWTFDVTEDQGSGAQQFVWESEIEGRIAHNGEDVLEWAFYRDGTWDQSIYILDEFTDGLHEAGGADPVQGIQTNDPPSPSLLARFTPGEAVSISFNSSAIGAVTGELTMTIEKEPLTVAAGTFTGLVKASNEYNSLFAGSIPISGTTTEWYALDVGLVKHVAQIDVLGTAIAVSFELVSYEVD